MCVCCLRVRCLNVLCKNEELAFIVVENCIESLDIPGSVGGGGVELWWGLFLSLSPSFSSTGT